MSEIDDLHESLLKTTAKCFALEALCLSLFKFHPQRKEVIAQFFDMKERLASKTLNDSSLLDAVPHEIDAAHAHIYSLLKTLDQPA